MSKARKKSGGDGPVAVILAAGKGTRMKGDRPKVLQRLVDRPLLDYPLALAEELKCRRVVVVVGHGAEEVERHLSERWAGAFARLQTVVQEPQIGTGHAVATALGVLPKRLGGPVLVLYGDVPLLRAASLRKLLGSWRRRKAAVAFLTMVLPDPGPYGRVVRDTKGRVQAIVEASDAPEEDLEAAEVNVGTYCFDPTFLRAAVERLGSANAQGEFYLTDTVGMAAEAGRPVATVKVEAHEALGINDRVDLAIAAETLCGLRVAELLEHGVSIPFPESVVIGRDVEVGPDTELGFGVHLLGKTIVGRGCVLETGAYLEDSRLADGVRIKPYSVLEEAQVGRDCQVGPFAHLRPGTVLQDGAKVGNFVETKKARLGPGVKANHLSYLGDCEVGEGTNVGAGTITCNYDGERKHRTVIGKRVLVGSDTQFVAPVSVGDDVVVGAGTTVLEDVPPGVVVVNEKRQKTWPRRKKSRRPKRQR